MLNVLLINFLMHLDLIVDQMKKIYLLHDEMEDEYHLLRENQDK
jgi:hypothetical protein